MCGRYLALSSPEALAERFDVDEIRLEATGARYNVAPSTLVPAILEDADSRRLGPMRWGFIPPWAGQRKRTPQPINARVESVATSRMFGPAFARRRCLLPADGFYEWMDRGQGRPKQPYHIADPDGQPLAFAGVWSLWRDPELDQDAEAVASVAIVTTAASGAMEKLHHRMPLILPRALWQDWLRADADQAPHLLEAVTALRAPRLVATPITTRVNSVANDGPDLLTRGTADG